MVTDKIAERAKRTEAAENFILYFLGSVLVWVGGGEIGFLGLRW